MHLLDHVPCFDLAAAASVAEQHYSIHTSATALTSERDQNFLLATPSGQKFVLKIANSLEHLSLLEAQNLALGHLGSRLSFCPRVVPSSAGELISRVESSTGATNFVRLLIHLSGVPLAKLSCPAPELLRDFGQKLGRLDRELADFDHPALHRNFHWDLANGMETIREYGPLIADAGLRELVFQCARSFERDINPLLPKLRRSVIHGDANDYNVLVSDDLDPTKQTVVGLIDFGDMVYSYTVGDLAVAIAYVSLDKGDPMGAASHMVIGYHEECPLSDDEFAALHGLVVMRLCMSVCLAAYQRRQSPDNDYLDISQRSIRNSLPALAAIDSYSAAKNLRKACGLDEQS